MRQECGRLICIKGKKCRERLRRRFRKDCHTLSPNEGLPPLSVFISVRLVPGSPFNASIARLRTVRPWSIQAIQVGGKAQSPNHQPAAVSACTAGRSIRGRGLYQE
ncbi:hypothetical protein BaRGS_00038836 [Batillaria attramentaria]|uniref:Uncharacterized protein n=1 Tax=Batillaria attramentaria TaxID=370345 RepID=A0ABD0J567_9CAEN